MDNTNITLMQLGNPSVPLNMRAQQLADILLQAVNGEKENCLEIAEEVMNRLQSAAGSELVAKKEAQLKEIMDQIGAAPLRLATFIESSNIGGNSRALRAIVMMDNGEMAHLTVPNQGLIKKLKIGDRILVDANMKLLVDEYGSKPMFGLEGRFERTIDERHIEVVNHQDEKSVVLVSEDMMAQIKEGKVPHGSSIILGSNGLVGVHALPAEEKVHFRFLDTGAVPDVLADRDIGSPPRIIGQVAKHVREEMTRPELRRRFKLRPCITRLLAGVSGSGKTLARQAIHRQMYEIMAEVTGTPIAELPPRVFSFRTSQMLSMWLGESDKNIDRLFDEVEELASKPWTDKNGKEFNLPVMVVLEEADGMGRSRGSGNDSVYDRILATMLQRLDPNREGLSKKLIVFISTTNNAELVDPAFLRRIGGSVEVFGRLDEKGFADVMLKHVEDLPAADYGNQKKPWPKIVERVSKWMFENGDTGILQLTYQGQSQPDTKYRKDFLTGALVDRAVQEAATKAWEESLEETKEIGIKLEHMVQSFNDQIASLAHQIQAHNVHNYLDIPEGARVTGVKRITAVK